MRKSPFSLLIVAGPSTTWTSATSESGTRRGSGFEGERAGPLPCAAGGHQQVPDRLFVLAPGPAVADDDGVPLAALDGRRDDLAAQGRLDQVVDLAGAHTQPGGPVAVEADLDVGLAPDRVGHDVDRARQRLHDPGHLLRAPDDVVEVAARARGCRSAC